MLRAPADRVREPDRLVRLNMTVQPRGMRETITGGFGYVTYNVMRHDAHVFDGVSAYTSSANGITMGEGAGAQLINLGEATADFFPVLGVQSFLGRFFTAEEDRPAAPEKVVVLGYGLWQRAFGSDRNVVGKAVILGGDPFTVVGVTPRGFTGPDLTRVDVWMPT